MAERMVIKRTTLTICNLIIRTGQGWCKHSNCPFPWDRYCSLVLSGITWNSVIPDLTSVRKKEKEGWKRMIGEHTEGRKGTGI